MRKRRRQLDVNRIRSGDRRTRQVACTWSSLRARAAARRSVTAAPTAAPSQPRPSAPQRRRRRRAVAPPPRGSNVVFIPKAINNPYFDAAAKPAPRRPLPSLGGQFSRSARRTRRSRAQIPFIQDRRPRASTRSPSRPTTRTRSPRRSRPPWRRASRSSATTRARPWAPTTCSSTRPTSASSACCHGRVGLRARARLHRRDRDPVGDGHGAPNQNAWIDAHEDDPDRPQVRRSSSWSTPSTATTMRPESTTQAEGLLSEHPDLKVIVAPTTVGILAAAQVVKQAGKSARSR